MLYMPNNLYIYVLASVAIPVLFTLLCHVKISMLYLQYEQLQLVPVR